MAPTAWPAMSEVIDEVREIVKTAKTIGCLAHKDADADSLGSALGFALAMKQAGKTVHTIVPSPTPELLRYLPGFDTLRPAPEQLDVLFTFDCATLARFGDCRQLVEDTAMVVNVDHHVSSEGFGTINIVDPAASATGQVVYSLLQGLDAPISADAATNLYAALFTDTGGFRHENTTQAALQLGADLVGLGADAGWVALKSYKSRSAAQVRLEALVVSRLKTDSDGALIWSEVTQAMLAETGATMEETEGSIDQLQAIDSMKMAIVFKEVSQVLTKISVRTRDEFDATEVCTPFGGGGHRRAAGAELIEPLPTAMERVLTVAHSLVT